MAANPNPARITDAIWWFWEQFRLIHPSVRLGGIYADKPGYHNTRSANLAKWPGNYSALLALDLIGPADKAAAIDLTFGDAQAGDYRSISKFSARLLASGKDLNDERGNYLREFYGQADADTAVEGWDYQAVGPRSSDASHLWHIHLSFMRAYVNDMKAMRAVLSILAGETVETWRARESGDVALTSAEIIAIAKAVWDVDYIPSGDPSNATWQGKNVVGTTMVRVTDTRDAVKSIAAKLDELAGRPPVEVDYAKLADAIVARLPELNRAELESAIAAVIARTHLSTS
jgi:hypothetical protein